MDKLQLIIELVKGLALLEELRVRRDLWADVVAALASPDSKINAFRSMVNNSYPDQTAAQMAEAYVAYRYYGASKPDWLVKAGL